MTIEAILYTFSTAIIIYSIVVFYKTKHYLLCVWCIVISIYDIANIIQMALLDNIL